MVSARPAAPGGRGRAAAPPARATQSVGPVAAAQDADLAKVPDTDLEWRSDVTGLALSGGGVRSATVALGLLQALARHGRLRCVDFLSTVSGGGYIGAFLGRWFARYCSDLVWGGRDEPRQSTPDRIERELIDPASPTVDWLRRQGNYLAPTGDGDGRLNWAVFLRGLVSVHFVVGSFVFVLFGLGNLFRYGLLSPGSALLSLAAMDAADLPLGHILKAALGVFYSPWFVVVELLLLVMVLPRIVGYWIVSQDQHERFSLPSLLLMFVVTGGLLYAGVADGFQPPFLVLGLAPYASFVSVELAWRRGRIREQAIGRGNIETQRLRTRNYLTYDLGMALALTGAALAFALIDTVGHALHQLLLEHNTYYFAGVASLMASVTALGPVTKYIAGLFTRGPRPGPPSTLSRLVREQAMAAGARRGAHHAAAGAGVVRLARRFRRRRDPRGRRGGHGPRGGRVAGPGDSQHHRLHQPLVAVADLRRPPRARLSRGLEPGAAPSAGGRRHRSGGRRRRRVAAQLRAVPRRRPAAPDQPDGQPDRRLQLPAGQPRSQGRQRRGELDRDEHRAAVAQRLGRRSGRDGDSIAAAQARRSACCRSGTSPGCSTRWSTRPAPPRRAPRCCRCASGWRSRAPRSAPGAARPRSSARRCSSVSPTCGPATGGTAASRRPDATASRRSRSCSACSTSSSACS